MERPFGANLYDSGITQHPDVVRHGRFSDRDVEAAAAKLFAWMQCQGLNDTEADRIAESVQNLCQCYLFKWRMLILFH